MRISDWSSDVCSSDLPGRAIRLGGMVAHGSIGKEADGVTYSFVVTDGARTVPVVFKGVPPDLFKEDSGVVVEGSFDRQGVLVADNLLAKHDERYMPHEFAAAMNKAKTLERSRSLALRPRGLPLRCCCWTWRFLTSRQAERRG